MEKWKSAGIKVIPVIASVAYALKMQELGATAVIAEGAESGGHIGENTTMCLVPQVVDAVEIPVLAAGGIAGFSDVTRSTPQDSASRLQRFLTIFVFAFGLDVSA